MDWKRYLPLEAYVLTTSLSPEQVYQRLSDNLEQVKTAGITLFNRDSSKPYAGKITHHAFTISRIISYRNSFLPIIHGEISAAYGKTQVKIKMRPAMPVLIFMSVWLGIVGVVCLGILFTGLTHITRLFQTGPSPIALIPFGMFIFGCLLINLSFKAESKKSKAFLATLLEGHETVNEEHEKDKSGNA